MPATEKEQCYKNNYERRFSHQQKLETKDNDEVLKTVSK